MGGRLFFFAGILVVLAVVGAMAALLVVDTKPPTRMIEKVVPDARLAR
ncbi:MAG: hypothetical protein AB7O45_05655 [Alphaproteobacteria bacterium]